LLCNWLRTDENLPLLADELPPFVTVAIKADRN